MCFTTENHILEDVNKCVMALQERDAHDLRHTAGAIHGRSQRVCNVVEAEMDNYEPCIYTKRVMEAVKILRDQVMSKFAQRVDVAVAALASNSPREVDENDFIDASRLVYDGVREIRRAVLMNRVSPRFTTQARKSYTLTLPSNINSCCSSRFLRKSTFLWTSFAQNTPHIFMLTTPFRRLYIPHISQSFVFRVYRVHRSFILLSHLT